MAKLVVMAVEYRESRKGGGIVVAKGCDRCAKFPSVYQPLGGWILPRCHSYQRSVRVSMLE